MNENCYIKTYFAFYRIYIFISFIVNNRFGKTNMFLLGYKAFGSCQKNSRNKTLPKKN